MKYVTLANFPATGSAQLTEQGVAVAIAPWSEVDVCLVGERPLSPGALVPWAAKVVAVRGWRLDLESTSAALSLLIYRECDPWSRPPLRAARVHAAIAQGFGSAGDTSAVRALRVPFSGWKQAAISFKRNDLAGDATLVVRGVRYRSQAELRAWLDGGFAGAPEPYFEELARASLVDVTGTVPKSQLGGGTSVKLGKVLQVGGGGDEQASFDELELWVFGDSGSVVSLQAEVSGDRG